MNHRVFDLSAGPYGSADMVVVRFQGREEISRLSSFEVTVAVSGMEPDRFQADVLGAAARLSFHADGGTPRRIHGIVRRVRTDAVDPEGGVAWYTLRLAPRMWLLGRKKRCRIFQDRSVPEIVGELLAGSGVEHRLLLARSYGPRPYCVQYHETDLSFVERLLAEEGIFYFIEDPAADAGEAAPETVVLCDQAERCLDVEGDRTVHFRPEAGMHGPEERIHRFGRRTEIRSGSATVQHFDYRRPTTDLSSRAEARAARGAFSEAALPIHDHDGEIEDPQVDPRAAEIRLEQARMRRVTSEGESRCRRLAPGRRFALADHPHADLNHEHVVLRVDHEGHQPEAAGAARDVKEVYENRFLCLPAAVPARPRRPRRRWQQVVETAMVVGPEGEEIHTDELGRIKVQFHWDRDGRRDDRSSCWIRVMQPWAGAAWGFQFVPRVGMEVVVAFSGGDVDRPLVLGCAYDGVLPPPFPLPKSKTRSGIRTRSTPGGDGYNEISFEDAAGKEQVRLHAQRDLLEVVEHDNVRNVGGDERVAVDGGRETSIAKDDVRTVQGNEVVTIEKNLVIHVVGRQIIQVDGRSGDAPAKGGGSASVDTLRAVEQAMAAAPAGDAVVPAVAAVSALPDLQSARVLFHVAHLDQDLRAAGARIEADVSAANDRVSALRDRVRRVEIAGKRLIARAERGEGRFIDLGAAMTLCDEIDVLRDQMDLAVGAITQQLIDARTKGEPRLNPAKDAAAARLRSAIAEVEQMSDESAAVRADVRRAQGLPEAGGMRIAPALRTGGVAHGGGGATASGFEKVDEMQFLGPPGDDGTRGYVTKQGGSMVNITGGGEIVSPDGFKIQGDGCYVELSGGIITLAGVQILLNATKIGLNAGAIEINGDTVTVKGGPIQLN